MFAHDGPLTQLVLRPLVTPVTERLRARHVSVTSVAVVSLAAGLCAALLAASGTRFSLIVGAALLALSCGADCVVTDLLRLTGSTQGVRTWLTSMLRRIKEFALLAGLAVGSARFGHDVWTLASVALAVVTFQGLGNESFRAHAAAGDRGVTSWVDIASRVRSTDWLLLAAIVMLVGQARQVLALLVVVVGALAVYGLVVRLATTWELPADRAAGERSRQLLLMADPGPLAFLVGQQDPQWSVLRRVVQTRPGWLTPQATWLVEAIVLIALVKTPEADVAPMGLLVLAVIALHRFDIGYRLRGGDNGPAGWVLIVGLGALGRALAYLVLAAATWLGGGLIALTLLWVSAFSGESSGAWAEAPQGRSG
ncbi:MAG TPA: hypothetical protein VMT27_00110 [Actinomycetes bacterium]|nr:hypothetical protein [Actinomycetes bacterium]